VVWEFALREGFVLVSKDTDFNDLVTLRGFPPKLIWLQIGNCTTQQIEDLLRRHQVAIEQFAIDAGAGVLALM
jgi:predicted nuclease of predicted toxin-antitoxin system